MNSHTVESILGRKEYDILASCQNLDYFQSKKILVTGACGSIGTAFCKLLASQNIDYISTDIADTDVYLDITDIDNVKQVMNDYKPNIVVHIAGMKHAPIGEDAPYETMAANSIGTYNVIASLPAGAKLIFCSTCKACNSETVYGASKLIAERMVLQSGGVVARFYNVIETQGNVFQIWEDAPQDAALLVAEICERYFISLREAIGLLYFCMQQEHGIFSINVPLIRSMKDIAQTLYPTRTLVNILPRRGDRVQEKLHASHEEPTVYYCDDAVVQRGSRLDC